MQRPLCSMSATCQARAIHPWLHVLIQRDPCGNVTLGHRVPAERGDLPRPVRLERMRSPPSIAALHMTDGQMRARTVEEMYARRRLIREETRRVLDTSLQPRGPKLLFELAQELGLTAGWKVLDVGCRDGDQLVELHGRIGCTGVGLEPVADNLARAPAEIAERRWAWSVASSKRCPSATRLRPRLGARCPGTRRATRRSAARVPARAAPRRTDAGVPGSGRARAVARLDADRQGAGAARQ